MTELRYEQPEPATAGAVLAALDNDDDMEAARLLIGAAMNHPDWREVQELCLQLLNGSNRNIAATAATALGHLARIHGELDIDVVRPRLEAHRDEPVVGPHVIAALDDIRAYIGNGPA